MNRQAVECNEKVTRPRRDVKYEKDGHGTNIHISSFLRLTFGFETKLRLYSVLELDFFEKPRC